MAGGGVGGPCGRRGGLVRVRHGYQAPGSEINLLIHNGQVSKVSLIVTFTLILKKRNSLAHVQMFSLRVEEVEENLSRLLVRY